MIPANRRLCSQGLLRLADWREDVAWDEQLPTCIHYSIGRQLTANRKGIARDTGHTQSHATSRTPATSEPIAGLITLARNTISLRHNEAPYLAREGRRYIAKVTTTYRMTSTNSCVARSSRMQNTSRSVELLPRLVVYLSVSLTFRPVKPQPCFQHQGL